MAREMTLDESSLKRKESGVEMNTVEVLEQVGDECRHRNSTWIKELRTETAGPPRIIFGTSKDLDTSTALRQIDRSLSAIPSDFWNAAARDMNGGFGSSYERDARGNVICHDTWCCFKIKQVSTDPTLPSISYSWQQIALFVKWRPTRNTEVVIVLDSPADLQTRLQNHFPSINPSHPYGFHVAFADEIKKAYDTSVWSLRDLVRNTELTRGTTEYFQPDFPRLHDIARHIIHSNETLDVAIDTIDTISHEHLLFAQEPNWTGKDDHPAYRQSTQHLYIISKEMKAIKRRSASLVERLQNEIKLAFNIVSQRNSQMTVQISANSRSDNEMMKTIAIVSLLYLPGTFVSGLFGMNFFQLSPSTGSGVPTWAVSKNFWLYWAITCPLTIATVLIWVMGHYWQEVKRQFASVNVNYARRRYNEKT